VYVPYKGTAPALTDLVGGQVDAFFDNIGSMQGQHNAGKARVLATAGRKRSPLLPDVPTLSEAGLPGFESGAWFGLVAPPDTPPEIAQKINAAVRDVMKSKEIQQKFLEQGAEIIGNSPQEMTEFVNGERMRWKKVVDSANVVLN
jgi:tripartite-type tricarboxylate transporter receptor subunit TctC